MCASASPPSLQLELLFEAAALLLRVVQFGKRVRDLHAAGIDLEALHKLRFVGLVLRERRDLDREVVDDRRLEQVRLGMLLEQVHQRRAGRGLLRMASSQSGSLTLSSDGFSGCGQNSMTASRIENSRIVPKSSERP